VGGWIKTGKEKIRKIEEIEMVTNGHYHLSDTETRTDHSFVVCMSFYATA